MDNQKIQTNGGDGPKSYAKNSKFQKQVVEYSKKVMTELIEQELDVGIINPDCSPFRVADFGCSIGENTYLAVQNIIEAVEQKYKSNEQNTEFLVLFNDVVLNDFNTLFNYIHSNKPNYYTAGVPGSFHGRVFPKAFLHFAKGRIHYSCRGAAKEVEAAYSNQFKKDMQAFLDARAQELVPGGLMAPSLLLLFLMESFLLTLLWASISPFLHLAYKIWSTWALYVKKNWIHSTFHTITHPRWN